MLLRTINSHVEFKQIIGRGTRLFDGKEYFTIYDFVKAYHHFNDPTWGEIDLDESEPYGIPEKCPHCAHAPCICVQEPEQKCPECGKAMCVCGEEPKRITKIMLSDGKVRELQHMIKTSFWSPEGKPVSAEEFLKSMFGVLPELFKSEDELRKIWSKPDTRKRLLEELNDKGFPKQQLEEFQKVLNAEDSDLYDVLAYVAFQSKIINRLSRAERAKVHFDHYDTKQQEFLDFVLRQYVRDGVDELDDSKISDLLILKYHALADAKKELGNIPSIRQTFIGFQEFLYEEREVG